jgi:uncharacterized repeat protein (TIGR03803 family)
LIIQWLLRPSGLIVSFLALGFGAEIAWAQIDEADAVSVKFTTLHSFDGTDGLQPQSGLVQVTNGDLYGTTSGGSDFFCGIGGACGTIFKITPSGTLTNLYSFCTRSGCPDGIDPSALVLAINGDLYGTTHSGGETNCGTQGGFCGTVFKITPSGELTTLHSFCTQSGCPDGAAPNSGLVQGNNGELYGMTDNWGAHGFGTVFKITPGGTLTTLYSFCSEAACSDGVNPQGGLVEATNGYFYGTTRSGGTPVVLGHGTIFRMSPSGTLTTLHTFCAQTGCADGIYPQVSLQASDGNLYGTTASGGASANCTNSLGCGTIFKLTPSGKLTTLYNFCAQTNCTDGANPTGLIQAANGELYGTTFAGGTNNGGTIFKITLGGALATLYRFCAQAGCSDGEWPQGGLVQDTNGKLYGTSSGGGTCCEGTVFSLSVGLEPFVKTLPTAGKIGEAIKILGADLTGATSVTFNGVAASFTVVSASEISTTVPISATTGHVHVTTPSGTLSSNVPFRVP